MHATRRGIAGSREHGCPGKPRMETCQIAHAPATSSKEKKQCDRPGLYDTSRPFTPTKVGTAMGVSPPVHSLQEDGRPRGQGYHHTTPHAKHCLVSHKQAKPTTLFSTLQGFGTPLVSATSDPRGQRATALHCHRPACVPVTVQSCG